MEENLKQQPTDILKIAFYGPESTGKTTLSNQLAQHFETVAVPEFARNYLQEKWDNTQTICQPEDLLPIAIGQIKSENESLKFANDLLFCDTNLLVTKAYSEIYYNFCNPILDKYAKKHNYDLLFFTDIDVPWEKDDLRDKPTERQQVFDKFQSVLIENSKPYILLSGNKIERFQKAVSIINDLKKIKKMGFSSHDYIQLNKLGISIEAIENQLQLFKNGIVKTILEKPATINDGILYFTEAECIEKANYFDSKKANLNLKKFVPASGAASRMFQFLNEFLNSFDFEKDTINAYVNKNNATELTTFLAGMEKFPFFQNIDNQLNNLYFDFQTWSRDKKNYHFIKYLIDKDFLDFANKPKGILPFHQYENHTVTPVEEHLTESVFYANSNGFANLHFTISEIHQKEFNKIIDEVKSKIELGSKTKINVGFSYQNKSTDTLAVDAENNPFRDGNNQLIFRPGGHGALIENLNNLDADVIFIKNIDNLIQNQFEVISLYKKTLAGILIELQEQIFNYLKQIDTQSINENDINTIINFAKNKLNIVINHDFEKYAIANKIEYLKQLLNRPIRVCGMVKNEGEPGGGPFWIRDKNRAVSLQIVESSQVDLSNKQQAQILQKATHFNPVDLVCSIKDYQSKKFNLNDFIDKNSGFIVNKTKNGRTLKGYELPGLWNGAMANWITIFVEVPIITFNPVKTVNDFLKPAHQN